MINITDIKIIEENTHEESGDVYYTLEVNVLEPGAAFSETSEEQLKNKVRQKLKNYFKHLEGMLNG